MSTIPIPLDISNNKDLLRLAEEVRETKTPRILKKDNETVAVLIPAEKKAGTAKNKPEKTSADYEAMLATFGSWKEVDTDTLLEHIYEDRKRSSRPLAKL